LNIDGENIGNRLGNHARLPKQGGQTTACKFDGWLKGWVNGRLPKGYVELTSAEAAAGNAEAQYAQALYKYKMAEAMLNFVTGHAYQP